MGVAGAFFGVDEAGAEVPAEAVGAGVDEGFGLGVAEVDCEAQVVYGCALLDGAAYFAAVFGVCYAG